jgi:hypothetical protein
MNKRPSAELLLLAALWFVWCIPMAWRLEYIYIYNLSLTLLFPPCGQCKSHPYIDQPSNKGVSVHSVAIALCSQSVSTSRLDK